MATKKTTFIPGITSSGSLPGIVTQSEQKARETYGMHFYHIDNIVPSNKNKRYPQIDLESLAASIIDVGLLHNLVVTKTDQKDTVRLISGERRYRACCLIRDEYPDDFKRLFPNGMLPCKMMKDLSDVDEEIALIEANAQVRVLDLKSRLDDINRLTELYTMRQEQGGKRIAEQISEALKMSERQVYKYMAIQRLNPILYEAWQNDIITINMASEIAGFGETEQLMLANILKEEGTITDEDVKSARELQVTKQKVEDQLDYTDRKLKTFQDIKENAGSEKEREFAQAKIDTMKQEQDELKATLSQTELKRIRTVKKATKLIDRLSHDLDSLDKMPAKTKDLPEVSAKLEMLKMRMEDVSLRMQEEGRE